MFFLSSSLPHFMSSYFILFLCTKEALQFLSLDGNRVISVKCSENVSERHRRAFDRRVTVRQVLTTLGIFLVASSRRRVVISCRVWLCFALFCPSELQSIRFPSKTRRLIVTSASWLGMDGGVGSSGRSLSSICLRGPYKVHIINYCNYYTYIYILFHHISPMGKS